MADLIEDTEKASDPRSNDAVWARFYRDGASLGEIAKEFGGSIYHYSPWLMRPLMQAGMEMAQAKGAANARLREALENIKAEAERPKGNAVHLKRVVALQCKAALET